VIGLIDIGALPVGAACMPSNGSLREPPALEGLSLASLTSHHVESASALAIIAASNEPLLYLAEDLTVIAASASFCRAFEIEPSSIPGRALSRLGAGEWDRPQLISLLKATASGNAHVAAYDIDLARKGRKTLCLVVNAHRLDDIASSAESASSASKPADSTNSTTHIRINASSSTTRTTALALDMRFPFSGEEKSVQHKKKRYPAC
jgi:PAS domain-containing protein